MRWTMSYIEKSLIPFAWFDVAWAGHNKIDHLKDNKAEDIQNCSNFDLLLYDILMIDTGAQDR